MVKSATWTFNEHEMLSAFFLLHQLVGRSYLLAAVQHITSHSLFNWLFTAAPFLGMCGCQRVAAITSKRFTTCKSARTTSGLSPTPNAELLGLRFVSRHCFFKWAYSRLFLFIFVVLNTDYKGITVRKSGIRTQIVRVQGMHADHLTTTTARDCFSKLMSQIENYERLNARWYVIIYPVLYWLRLNWHKC